MTIYISEKEAKKAGLVKDTRQKRGRNTKPGIPAAGRSPSTGLTTLIAGPSLTWSLEYVVGRGYRLYVINQPQFATAWLPSEAAACAAAREQKA
jgi:hypothetical protein